MYYCVCVCASVFSNVHVFECVRTCVGFTGRYVRNCRERSAELWQAHHNHCPTLRVLNGFYLLANSTCEEYTHFHLLQGLAVMASWAFWTFSTRTSSLPACWPRLIHPLTSMMARPVWWVSGLVASYGAISVFHNHVFELGQHDLYTASLCCHCCWLLQGTCMCVCVCIVWRRKKEYKLEKLGWGVGGMLGA